MIHANIVTPGNLEPNHHGVPVPPPVGRIDIVARILWLLRRLDRLERHVAVLDGIAARDDMTGTTSDPTFRDRRDRARAALLGAEAVLADLTARHRKAQGIAARQDRADDRAKATPMEFTARFVIAKAHRNRLRKDDLARLLVAALNAAPGATHDKLAEMIGRPVDYVRIKLAKMTKDGALIDMEVTSVE